MFIRKKINKNGSYTVLLVAGERVPGKKNPVTRTIKHFGTAKNKKRLKSILKEAEEYKKHLESISPKIKTLKIASDLDVKSCRSYNTGFLDVYGEAFDSVFAKSDLDASILKQLRDLVVMRIAAPASKLKTTRLAAEYGISCKVDGIYKFMDKINISVIDKIKKVVYRNTKELLSETKRDIDILFYDLTTVYFETSSQDEVRDFGFSKDGKHRHVQIMLAIIVTTEGLPIDYKEFPGNFYEGHTLIPALNEIKERYNINKVVLVADAALMNRINLKELEQMDIKYIISARIRNTKKEIKKELFDINTYDSISRTMDFEGDSEEIRAKKINSGIGDFIIAYYSTKRARKDEHDRQKDLERIEKHINSTAKSKLTGSLRKSYVKVSKFCKIEIDQKKLELDRQYDGFFGLRTNIKDANPLELLSSYRGLWQIEQTFRITKNSLEIRPVFHYSPRRIRAHFAFCYIALALVRHIEFILKKHGTHIPHEKLHLMLDRMRKVQIIDDKDYLFEFMEDPPIGLLKIYQALKIKWPKKFGCKSICSVSNFVTH